ncbi:hypothetical protein Tco_0312702 [Tanacetum coccineum]
MLVKTSEKQAIWQRTIDSILDTFNLVHNVVCQIELLTSLKMMEHDDKACIYGVLVSVGTNNILMKDEFPVLDIGKEFIWRMILGLKNVQSWVTLKLGGGVLLEEKKQVVQQFKCKVRLLISTLMAFGENTHDLDSIREETDKTTTLHQLS